MVGIFFLFLVVQGLIFFEKRKIALIIFLICMGLTVALLIHHITVKLPVQL